MALFDELSHLLRDYARRRRQRRRDYETRLAVSELPPELQRDIGWPGAYERMRREGRL